MGKRTLQLVLLSNDGEGGQGVIHPIKTYRVPTFNTDRYFQQYIRDTKHDVKVALARKAYEDSLPEAGMASGSW